MYLIPLMGFLALIYSFIKSKWITKQEPGNEKMIEIAGYIRDGAIAFLKTEYKVLAIFVVTVALLLGCSNSG